jgi:hypothetical protein
MPPRIEPKLVWRVAPAPSGPYRAFALRSWPSAFFFRADGPVAATIGCSERYEPSRARTGQHPPLIVRVYDWRGRPGIPVTTLRLKDTYPTLETAKAAVRELYRNHPHFIPQDNAA